MKIYQYSLLIILTVVTGGCVPTKYTPRYDMTPLLSLRLPSHIDSIENIPKDEVYVSNGINQLTGKRERDDAKDKFIVKSGNCACSFWLYYSENSAKYSYKSFLDSMKYFPVYTHGEVENVNYAIFYTERPRSDVEGWYSPMNFYISRGIFRSGNLIVYFGVTGESIDKVDLTDCIKRLSEILKQHIEAPNKPLKRDAAKGRRAP